MDQHSYVLLVVLTFSCCKLFFTFSIFLCFCSLFKCDTIQRSMCFYLEAECSAQLYRIFLIPLHWLQMRVLLVPASTSFGLEIMNAGQSMAKMFKILSSFILNLSKFLKVQSATKMAPCPKTLGSLVRVVNCDRNISWRLWNGLSRMSPSTAACLDWQRSAVTAPMLLPHRQTFSFDCLLSQATTGPTCSCSQQPKDTIPSVLMSMRYSYLLQSTRCSQMVATLNAFSSKIVSKVSGSRRLELQEWMQRTVGPSFATQQKLKGTRYSM